MHGRCWSPSSRRGWMSPRSERIALAFATRAVGSGLARFPQLRVEPLGRRDARALLESVLAARLDESEIGEDRARLRDTSRRQWIGTLPAASRRTVGPPRCTGAAGVRPRGAAG